MTESILTQDYLKSILRYDPKTGYLYWKVRKGNIKIGTRAGYINKTARYIQVKINNKKYQAHRLIWLLIYGEFPPNEIDHINKIRHDNRPGNLRSVTCQENMRNQSLYSNSKSGVHGVNWDRPSNKWRARVRINRKDIHLGYFKDWFDAVCVRKAAEHKYGFHPNHGRR